MGKTFDDLIPDIADDLKPLYRSVFESGDALLGFEITGETASQAHTDRSWLCDLYPVTAGDGVFAVGVCVREVTDQKHMIERVQNQNDRQKVLLGELQHRVKNTLATIQAISKLLLRTSADPDEYQSRLSARLNAMAQTHDLLTDANWTAIPLRTVIERELQPYGYGENAFSIEGPRIELSTRQTMAVGMAVHELATNAAKYGALTREGGHVDIAVSLEGGIRRVEWKERGGPTIDAEPSRRGFGSIMLENIVASDLDGEIEILHERDGLRCVLVFPEDEE